MKLKEKYSYIDRSGKTVIKGPFVFAEPFSEGRARVGVQRGRFAEGQYVDRAGKVVIPAVKGLSYQGDFHEGRARVQQSSKLAWDPSGYIDETGKLVIAAEWDEAGDFSGGLALVRKDRRRGNERRRSRGERGRCRPRSRRPIVPPRRAGGAPSRSSPPTGRRAPPAAPG